MDAAAADGDTMAHPAPTALPPPLSSTPSVAEMRRLLDGLRSMASDRRTGPPPPPAPLPRRRWGLSGSSPALVRPYVLAALSEPRT